MERVLGYTRHEQYIALYPEGVVPFDTFAQHQKRTVERFMESGSVFQRKSPGRPKIVTEEVHKDISQQMRQSPNKCLHKLSQQTGLSYGNCLNVVHKQLHMHPYKMTVVQQLFAQDFNVPVQYCQWFLDVMNDNDVLDNTFLTDEAWFHLSGYVNSQNYRTWSIVNPHMLVETSLQPIKIGVWVAMSRRRVIGPIFFHETINAERYREQILNPFIAELNNDEMRRGYFQQDGATAHTAAATWHFLETHFPQRVIS